MIFHTVSLLHLLGQRIILARRPGRAGFGFKAAVDTFFFQCIRNIGSETSLKTVTEVFSSDGRLRCCGRSVVYNTAIRTHNLRITAIMPTYIPPDSRVRAQRGLTGTLGF